MITSCTYAALRSEAERIFRRSAGHRELHRLDVNRGSLPVLLGLIAGTWLWTYPVARADGTQEHVFAGRADGRGMGLMPHLDPADVWRRAQSHPMYAEYGASCTTADRTLEAMMQAAYAWDDASRREDRRLWAARAVMDDVLSPRPPIGISQDNMRDVREAAAARRAELMALQNVTRTAEDAPA